MAGGDRASRGATGGAKHPAKPTNQRDAKTVPRRASLGRGIKGGRKAARKDDAVGKRKSCSETFFEVAAAFQVSKNVRDDPSPFSACRILLSRRACCPRQIYRLFHFFNEHGQRSDMGLSFPCVLFEVLSSPTTAGNSMLAHCQVFSPRSTSTSIQHRGFAALLSLCRSRRACL